MAAGRRSAQISDVQESAPKTSPRPRPKGTKISLANGAALVDHHNDAVINFNRSRRKKVTAAIEKTSRPLKPSKATAQQVESQSEREAFARNFRILRKQAGLSQRDIQKLTGIAQSHVSEIESAMHNICIETMVKLAKLVKRPIHELFKQ